MESAAEVAMAAAGEDRSGSGQYGWCSLTRVHRLADEPPVPSLTLSLRRVAWEAAGDWLRHSDRPASTTCSRLWAVAHTRALLLAPFIGTHSRSVTLASPTIEFFFSLPLSLGPPLPEFFYMLSYNSIENSQV